ncbi:MAG: MFS transporter [Planctomycetota bacterium]
MPKPKSAAPPTPPAMTARLSAMMFLETWPLGLWAVTIGTYIAANTGTAGDQLFSSGFVGYWGAAGAFGGMLSPAVVGVLSDRLFSAQRVLVGLHFLCAIALAAVAYTGSRTEIGFFITTLLYFQVYVPTVTLTNTIAMRNLEDVDRDYPPIRVAATASWILAGWTVGLAWPWATGESIEATLIPVWIAAASHIAMAFYSFTLPDTPPTKKPGFWRNVVGADLWGNRTLVAFLGVSLLACAASQPYDRYVNVFLNNQGYENAAAKLTLGQATEVVCLFTMPLLLRHFGLRTLFTLGVLGWGLRYALLAAGASWNISPPVYGGILLHGPCFSFVYVAGQCYIDRLADRDSRGAAQGMHTVIAIGVGHMLGAVGVGVLQREYLTPPGVSPAPYEWDVFWSVGAVWSVGVAVLFWAIFRDDADDTGAEVHADDTPIIPAEPLTEPMPSSR